MESKFEFGTESIKDSPMLSAEQIVEDIMKHLSDANKYSSISRKSLKPLLERYFHFWINKSFSEGQQDVIDCVKMMDGKNKEEHIEKALSNKAFPNYPYKNRGSEITAKTERK